MEMNEFKHGIGGYTHHKCRCDICRSKKVEQQTRYEHSPRGKAVRARINAKHSKTPGAAARHREDMRKYYKTPRGKTVCKLRQAIYNKSLKGKESHSRSGARYYEKNKNKILIRLEKWRKSHLGQRCALSANRRALELHATPPWLTKQHLEQVKAFYIEASRLSKETKISYSVDHVWPLKGKGFNGLHVPWNLRVIPLKENLKKNNKTPQKELTPYGQR